MNIAGVANLDIVNLPNFKTSDLPSIESADDYPLFAQWLGNQGEESALLNTTALTGQCNNMPSFRVPLPYDADGTPESIETGTVPSIFGTTTGGDVFLYDRHLSLLKNTVDNPLPDGGGSLVMETYDTPGGVNVRCHNVPRSYNNEEGCKLSYLPTACAADTDPKNVIIMNEANLAGIRTASNRSLYAVTGLAMTDATPCVVQDSFSGHRSRWLKDETDTVCENTVGIGAGTYKTFKEFIDMRNIGTVNDNIVDVLRRHTRCDVDDETKGYLGKIKASDGSCWEHVHIAEMDILDLTDVDEALYDVTGPNMVTFNTTELFDSAYEPTAASPADGTLVKTIFPTGSTVEDFGCNDGSRPWRVVDGTTVQYDCFHSGNNTGTPYVFTVTPDHGLHTIAKGLRFYSGASCIYCQPVTYVFQGRASAEDPWTEIASGELPWISAPLSSNPAWLPINSTYEDGDSDHSFTAVDFPSQDTAYLEYRFSFPLLRGGADGTLMRFGELEVPGKSNIIFSVLVNQPFLFGVKLLYLWNQVVLVNPCLR